MSIEEDRLERGPFARQVALQIDCAASASDSVVFGLVGPWGCGKTSVITMVEEVLTEAGHDWEIRRFSPWAASNVDGMLAEFYATLSSVVPEDKMKAFREKVQRLARVSVPALSAIPLVGAATTEVADRIMSEFIGQKSWREHFQEVADLIMSLDRPVLIIADDIDRLDEPELLSLLKVVRLLGSFPRVHYLLAYDEKSVTDLLAGNSTNGARRRGARFMEKIVQYPIHVPPLMPRQLLNLLNIGMTEIFDDLNRRLTDYQRGWLAEVLIGHLGGSLSTIRSVDRYLSSVRFDLEASDPEEIDDADVILLTLLRVNFRPVYDLLPTCREELLAKSLWRVGEPKRGDSARWERLDPVIQELEYPDAVRKLLTALFPKLREHPGSLTEDADRRRVANGDYFDRYFTMTIPFYDIPDAVVGEGVRDLAAGQLSDAVTRLTNAFLVSDFSAAALAFNKAEDAGALLQRQTWGLFESIFDLIPRLSDPVGTFFSPRQQAMRWCGRILAALESDDIPADASALMRREDVDLSDRIRVIWRPMADKIMTEIPSVLLEPLLAECRTAVLDHLRRRDEADSASHGRYRGPITFTMYCDGEKPLKKEIELAITRGEFDVLDLASRLVDTDSLGGNWEITQFRTDWFDRLAPDWSPRQNPPTIDSIDLTNLNWPNLRRFALASLAARNGEEAQATD